MNLTDLFHEFLYNFKRYFWSFLGVLGVVCFWAGVWDGVGYLPYLDNPLISLFVGLIILASSGLIFKEFQPLSDLNKEINLVLYKVIKHPNKEKFDIKYDDKLRDRHIIVNAKNIHKVEKNSFIVIHDKNKKEKFIPIERVKEILHQGKSHWKPKHG